MAKGYFSLVLHGHLPYVRHPEYEDFFEERWLFEAITECYIPLVQMCYKLLCDGVRFRFALSLSPTLCAMLRDELLQKRYIRHLEKLIELSEKEIARTSLDPRLNSLAKFYRDWLNETLGIYHVRYGRDLLKAFKRFHDVGAIELFTTCATHGYLPLLKTHPRAVEAQVRVGAESFRHTFGFQPRGIWAPECAFYPGLETVFADGGFDWFLVDSHGILHATARPHYGLFAPIACDNGVAAFGRDPESSRQVWSSHEGYPGDFDYRDFYRDLGFDADFEYIKPYILDGKTRILTGIKYHRVTGRGEHKELYDPRVARAKADLHAAHFLECRQKQIEWHAQRMDRPPLVVSPYDAELFGHWWFEGPWFLESLARRLHTQDIVEPITPSDYLKRHPVLQRSTPSASSWGWQGYNDCWLSGCNEWIYPELHRAAGAMIELATRFQTDPRGSLRERALNQAARSLLLAQSSDWPFIIKCGTAVDYANKRVKDHLARFHYLCDAVRKNDIDPRRLAALEQLDNIFPFIDFRIYANTAREVEHLADNANAAQSGGENLPAQLAAGA
jgi:1,4-alpha-glucan branching enzyme